MSFIFDAKFRAIEGVPGWIFLSTALGIKTASFGQQILFLTGGRSLYAIAIATCIGKFFTVVPILLAARKTLLAFPVSNVSHFGLMMNRQRKIGLDVRGPDFLSKRGF